MHCLVAKGFAICYIYVPEMTISKILANGFLVCLHEFFFLRGQKLFLNVSLDSQV